MCVDLGMGYNRYFKTTETMKLIDARRDHYRKLAHEEGFRSRSAYKLKELNKAYRIIGPGFFVLDLGCAPGGWTQVAVQVTGNQGKVLGVDTSYVEDIPGAELLKGNIEDAPCLICPVEQKCTLEGEISPRICVWIEEWVTTGTSQLRMKP